MATSQPQLAAWPIYRNRSYAPVLTVMAPIPSELYNSAPWLEGRAGVFSPFHMELSFE